MNKSILILLTLSVALFLGARCVQTTEGVLLTTESEAQTKLPVKGKINEQGSTVHERFPAPEGYVRIKASEKSFAHYLRSLPLKPHGSLVTYYNGEQKYNNGVYHAVIDLPIGKKDLHQCADAVMRLWGEYLWTTQQYDRIHFNLTNGFRVDYSKWMKGFRVSVQGNSTSWKEAAAPPSVSYADFWKYMEFVFTYAGTLSLSKELKPVSVEEMEIGDVFILGGSPGHAVLVIDMVEHPATGKKLFMLAQSYMPAQETQILTNPQYAEMSPWYDLDFGESLRTPEWRFSRNQLMRFEGE
jgi:hypothetical protein